MTKNRRLFRLAVQSCFAFSLCATSANAADPSVRDALDLKPVQSDVQFERPTKEQIEKCTIQKISQGNIGGWIVRDSSGQPLRRFVDSNKDGKLDQWCYYRDGVEVYRDLDTNYNGKADQYRWLGIAGIRWGLDDNEDGRIDNWKVISPEEVTAEVVAAVREKDAQRFARLLLTGEELKSLGLDEQRESDIGKKVGAARTGFSALADRQKVITAKTEWTNFGATQPGVLAAGTDGTSKDVTVYENVAAMVDIGGKSAQVAVGTLVQVGSTWRLIDLPGLDNQQTTNGNHFFLPIPGRGDAGAPTENALTPAMQKLVSQLEELDTKLSKGKGLTPAEITRIHSDKAAIIERLYDASTSDEDRQNWIRQLADSISATVQSGDFPDGIGRLSSLAEKLKNDKAQPDLTAYVEFRYISSKYSQEVQDPKADVTKAQSTWIENLENFVATYPKSPDAAEAMFLLANAHEFSGKTDSAIEWYSKVYERFPKADMAPKAAGAKFRLESVGKTLSLKGKSLIDGKSVDLTSYRGQVVLIHYWATWCEPCKQDLDTLRNMQTKYGKRMKIIGINLDNDSKVAQGFLRTSKVNWEQLYEPGGLDSRLANELGVFTLPTMLLVDNNGKVINRNIHAAELDSEFGRLFKEPSGAARAPTATTKGR